MTNSLPCWVENLQIQSVVAGIRDFTTTLLQGIEGYLPERPH
jgi:hypothetical protein